MDSDELYERFKAEGKIYGFVSRENIRMLSFPRVPVEIIDRLKPVKDLTCLLADILYYLGYIDGRAVVPAHVLKPLDPECKVVGTAITQRNIPGPISKQIPYEDKKLEAYRDLQYLAMENDVLILESKDCDACNMGEVAASINMEHNIAGSIIDGYIRDGESVRKLGYPVWSRGSNPLNGVKYIETVEINGPVAVYNVQVRPGDLVAADSNGICFIPRAILGEVMNCFNNKVFEIEYEETHEH